MKYSENNIDVRDIISVSLDDKKYNYVVVKSDNGEIVAKSVNGQHPLEVKINIFKPLEGVTIL